MDAEAAGALLSEAFGALAEQPSLLRVTAKRVIVVGDTHGDITTSWAAVNDHMDEGTTLLFLGDYVDRGPFQIENVQFLLKKFLELSGRVLLLRGNHETPEMNESYGFADAVARRYGPPVHRRFLSVFAQLPITAIVNDVFLAVHGGIARTLRSVDQLSTLPKGVISPEGILAEVMWNDPDENVEGFEPSPRGPGIFRYGPDVLSEFLRANKLKGMLRSHEPREEGAAVEMGGMLYTVFSCRYYGVTPGYLDVDGDRVLLKKF